MIEGLQPWYNFTGIQVLKGTLEVVCAPLGRQKGDMDAYKRQEMERAYS